MKLRYKLLIFLAAIIILPLASYGATHPNSSGISGKWFINTTINPPNLDSGLVGHWTFDGNHLIQNATDSSGQGNNGSLVGFTSTTTVAGKLGQALQFDGVNDYVKATTVLGFSTPRTVSMWIKFGRSNFDVFFYSSTGTSGVACSITSTGDGVNQPHCSFNSLTGNKTSMITIGQWYHLAFTTTGSDQPTMYLNGTLNSTGGDYSLTSTKSSTLIGADHFNVEGDIPFQGAIDDVRVYNRVLSAAEIKQLYNSSATTYVNTTINPLNLESGLVGHWTFDGNDLIQNARDSAGTNNGLLLDFTSTTTTAGVMGQGLTFDGTNDHVNITNVGYSALTFSAWYKTANNNQVGIIFGELGGDSSGGGKIGIVVNNFFFRADGGTADTSIAVPTAGKWHHVALMRNASNSWTICSDGACTSVGTGPGSATYNLNRIVCNGGAVDQCFNGSLDDIRIYNRALSAAEIKQLYNLGI